LAATRGYRTLILVGAGAIFSLAALYVLRLFYLQFIVAVSGVAAVACIAAWDRQAGTMDESVGESLDPELARVVGDLERLEERLSETKDGGERRYLRRQRSSLQQELRGLRWVARERQLGEASKMQTGALTPLPGRPGGLEKRAKAKMESRHLREALEEAAQVLLLDPPDSVPARLALIANDVRANYDLLKGSAARKSNLNDYGAAWAVLASLSSGLEPDSDTYGRASSEFKKKLDTLAGLAAARQNGLH
jgi:hypothetical protein